MIFANLKEATLIIKRVVSLKILDMCDSVVCMLDSKDEQPNGWVVHVYVGV